MGKLEDIPKKQFFNVPDGYFDRLPAQIQSRIATGKGDTRGNLVFRYALQYALPVLLVAAVLFYYSSIGPDPESILASVETADLINYLQEAGLTTEDVLENIEFNAQELEAIENEVYELNFQNMDDETLDLELNTL
ncbi:MAG: hypothetical protein WD824_24420 [Cyclobacteriaceae bacterium]